MRLPEKETSDRIDEEALNQLSTSLREAGWQNILIRAVVGVIRDEDVAKAMMIALARKLAEHYDPAPLLDDSDELDET